jgi:rhodanese-related sulfurtransferase
VRRRGPDTFGIALIGTSTLFVIILLFFLASQRPATNTATVPNINDPLATGPTPDATQQTIVFLTQTAELGFLSPEEARALHGTQSARFIDVRPAEQYAAQHIRGATNIPYTEAEQRASEFPKEGTVILYCQWPNDEESASVALGLRNQGYTNIKVLKGPYSFDRWKSAGYPVEP